VSNYTGNRKKWDALDSVILLILVLLTRELVGRLVQAVNPGANPIGVLFSELVIMGLVLFLLHFYVIEYRYMGTGRVDFRMEKPVWYLQIGVFFGSLSFLFLNLGYFLLLRLAGVEMLLPWTELIRSADHILERILLLLSLVVLLPAIQETIFRGFLYGALRNTMGVFGALLVSSLIFCLLVSGPWLIPVYLLGSMVMGFSYELTGSVYTSMVAAGTWNLLLVIYGWIF